MHWQWSAARALVEVERPVRAAVAEHAIAEASTARARARRIVRADPRDVVDALAADGPMPVGPDHDRVQGRAGPGASAETDGEEWGPSVPGHRGPFDMFPRLHGGRDRSRACAGLDTDKDWAFARRWWSVSPCVLPFLEAVGIAVAVVRLQQSGQRALLIKSLG